VAALYEKGSADEQQRYATFCRRNGRNCASGAESYPPIFADKDVMVSADL
jgi:hypothetical protein